MELVNGNAAQGAVKQELKAPLHQRVCLNPPEIYHAMAEGGAVKARNSFLTETILGMLAGAYIGFGFSLCMLVAGQLSPAFRAEQPGVFNFLFGIYGFPMGLSMCVINGASVFTVNVAFMLTAFIQKKATVKQSMYILVWSYIANLAGSLLLMMLMWQGGVYAGREEFTIQLALRKTSLSFGTAVTRGILCNWLVCMAVWQGNAAQDITGKLLGVFFPLSAFVSMGFEHCIANQFLIPLAMRLGAPITVGTFLWKNLIPVTLGNIIAGAVFVGGSYGLAYGDWGKSITAAGERAWARMTGKYISASTLPDTSTHSVDARFVVNLPSSQKHTGA